MWDEDTYLKIAVCPYCNHQSYGETEQEVLDKYHIHYVVSHSNGEHELLEEARDRLEA